MKATDLMTGDWVQIVSDAPTMANEYHRIDWIRTGEIGLDNRKIVTYPFIQPIPLTPEILEKNGFTHKYYGIYRLLIGDSLWIDIYKEGGIIKDRRISPEQDYRLPALGFVHELQHALRLCGIEKEIEL